MTVFDTMIVDSLKAVSPSRSKWYSIIDVISRREN